MWQGSQILKKGKYGFYNAPNTPVHSIYENFDISGVNYPEARPIVNQDGKMNTNISYSENTTATPTSTTTTTTTTKTSIENAGNVASSFQKGTTDNIIDAKVGSQSQYNEKLKKDLSTVGNVFNEDIQKINEDATNMKNSNDPESRFMNSLQFFIDVRKFLLDIVFKFDFNTHPNFFDIIGESFGESYYYLFGEIDGNDKDHYKEYILAVIYFFWSIFLAYFATKNWYYFLAYEFSKTSSVLSGIQETYEYFQNNKFYYVFWLFASPVLYPVYIIAFYLSKLRSNFMETFRTGYFQESFDHCWMVQIVLFFILFLFIQNWTTISNYPVFIALFFSLSVICIFGNLSKIPILHWSIIILIIILFFVLLYCANASIHFINLFVMSLFLFITFLYIVVVEYGIFKGITALNEINLFYNLLYDNTIIKLNNEKKDTNKFLIAYYYFGKFANNNWFLFCISFIVFGFMVYCFSNISTLTIHLGCMALAFLLCFVMLLVIRFINLYNTEINETTLYYHIDSLSELFQNISQDKTLILSSSIQYLLSSYKKQIKIKDET